MSTTTTHDSKAGTSLPSASDTNDNINDNNGKNDDSGKNDNNKFNNGENDNDNNNDDDDNSSIQWTAAGILVICRQYPSWRRGIPLGLEGRGRGEAKGCDQNEGESENSDERYVSGNPGRGHRDRTGRTP
ncbi:hypothetical protein EDB85DRAFT_1887638 [Lactarius pseudohatsudake]|nr:hypothetical protein EDB85DRAFT_1887638 [Lactarius pseudohatsudake]